MTFDTDLLDLAKAHIHDFLQASGFEFPEEEDYEQILSHSDFLAKEEDWMWSDALASKFRNDKVGGGRFADVIQFPVSDS